MNKSPLVMEVDSQISLISPPNRLSYLNLINVSSLNKSVIPEQQEFENTTIVDLEYQDTVIGGIQVTYHEESESPNINTRGHNKENLFNCTSKQK